MSDKIIPGEIICANITFVTKKKKTKIEVFNEVYSRPYKGTPKTTFSIENQEDKYFLRRYGISEDADMVKIVKVKSLGFKVQNAGYIKAEKNDTDMKRQKSGGYN